MKTKILGAMFGAMLMVTAIGGTAFAARGGLPGPDAAAGANPGRAPAGQVTVCHKGHLIDVSANSSHIAHGDPVDAC